MSENLNLTIERIHKLDNKGPVKAFVDISINDVLLVRGFRVVNGSKGIFVTVPQDQGKDKRWYDSVKFLSEENRVQTTEKIMEAYNETLQEV